MEITVPTDGGNGVALVLFGHGARDPQWARPMQAIRQAILARQPGLPVELAYLEYMAPSLADCVGGLAMRGFREVRIFPVFIAQGGHLVREVPLMLTELRQRYPGVRLELLPVAGESPLVVAAMAAAACMPPT